MPKKRLTRDASGGKPTHKGVTSRLYGGNYR